MCLSSTLSQPGLAPACAPQTERNSKNLVSFEPVEPLIKH